MRESFLLFQEIHTECDAARVARFGLRNRAEDSEEGAPQVWPTRNISIRSERDVALTLVRTIVEPADHRFVPALRRLIGHRKLRASAIGLLSTTLPHHSNSQAMFLRPHVYAILAMAAKVSAASTSLQRDPCVNIQHRSLSSPLAQRDPSRSAPENATAPCTTTLFQPAPIDTDCTFYATTTTITSSINCSSCALVTRRAGLGLVSIHQPTMQRCDSRNR